LKGEVGDVGGQREFQEKIRPEVRVGEKKFGIARINEDGAKD
jgi:hypothetical protein